MCHGNKRWGNTLDLIVLCKLFDVHTQLVHCGHGTVLWRNASECVTIAYDAHHFTLRQPTRFAYWPLAGSSEKPKTTKKRAAACGCGHSMVGGSCVKWSIAGEEVDLVACSDTMPTGGASRDRRRGTYTDIAAEAERMLQDADRRRERDRVRAAATAHVGSQNSGASKRERAHAATGTQTGGSTISLKASNTQRGPPQPPTTRSRPLSIKEERPALRRVKREDPSPGRGAASGAACSGAASRAPLRRRLQCKRSRIDDEVEEMLAGIPCAPPEACPASPRQAQKVTSTSSGAHRAPLARNRIQPRRRQVDATNAALASACEARTSLEDPAFQCSVIRAGSSLRGQFMFVELGLQFEGPLCDSYEAAELAVLEVVLRDLQAPRGLIVTALKDFDAAEKYSSSKGPLPVVGGTCYTAVNLLFKYMQTAMGFDDVNDLNGHCRLSVSLAEGGFFADLVCPDSVQFTGPLVSCSRMAAKVAHLALQHYKRKPLFHVAPQTPLEAQSLGHFRRSFQSKHAELAFMMRVKRLAKAITVARVNAGDDHGEPATALAERVCLAEQRDGLAEAFDILTLAVGPALARRVALLRFPRGSAGHGLRESLTSPFISDELFTTLTGIQTHPALEDLSTWGHWSGNEMGTAPSSSSNMIACTEPGRCVPAVESADVLSDEEFPEGLGAYLGLIWGLYTF
eukprot:6491565-Amphidinium_carterae.1